MLRQCLDLKHVERNLSNYAHRFAANYAAAVRPRSYQPGLILVRFWLTSAFDLSLASRLGIEPARSMPTVAQKNTPSTGSPEKR